MFKNLKNTLNQYIFSYFKVPEKIIENISYDENIDKRRLGFGDISCNAPLLLAKITKKNPLDIGKEISQNFSHPDITSIDCIAPGFLNITIKSTIYNDYVHNLKLHPENLYSKSKNPISYNIEFVSANPTGPLHIGHGRGGIIGDVLARVLKSLGHKVETEYYINDAGSQIDKLAKSFDVRCKQLSDQSITLDDDMYQGEYLINLATEFCAQNNSNTLTYEEKKDHISKKLLSTIKTTLTAYRITFDTWFSEKTLHESDAIENTIKKLQDKNFIYKSDDESLWLKTTEFGDDKDRVVKRSNGQWTYVAADIAYLINKFNRSFDKLIMILGQDHHSYVNRLKAATQALGYQANQLDVILYQLVTLKENDEILRLSKRAGRMIYLSDIIESVGTDIARFFYLNKKADAHLEFDVRLAHDTSNQNPVYYIQYAYVRLKSVLSKEEQLTKNSNVTEESSYSFNEYEKHIIRKISTLDKTLKTIERTYQTHLLAHYTLELSSLIHTWYAQCKIIDISNPYAMAERINLVSICMKTLSTCLNLLNISKPEKM